MIDVGIDLTVEKGQLCLCRGRLRRSARDIEFVSKTGTHLLPCQDFNLALGVEIALRNRTARLCVTKIDIDARDLALQRHERAVRILDGRLRVRVRRFNRPPHAAKQIEFP